MLESTLELAVRLSQLPWIAFMRVLNAARYLVLLLCAGLFAACGAPQDEPVIEVTIRVDGDVRALVLTEELTVDQLLSRESITLAQRDRLSHPLVSPLAAGMIITIRRVTERQECELSYIYFERHLLPKESLRPREEQLGQAGAPGIEEACYLVSIEDDVEVGRQLLSAPAIVEAPTTEITYYGIDQIVAPVPIAGRLSYINHGEAWTIVGEASNKRRLSNALRLDSLVFDQDGTGERLLVTAETAVGSDFFNALWLLPTAGRAEPVRLTPSDVLYAEWRPHARDALAYSTGLLDADSGQLRALNNLWLLRLDLGSGRALSIEAALPESPGGAYAAWGTGFVWSPNGANLAWSRANGFGLVDLAAGRLNSLRDYAAFDSGADWTWRTQLSWSSDSRLLLATSHGAPIAKEPATASPVFDVTVVAADGSFAATMSTMTGMWAAPTFSPVAKQGEFNEGYIAWLAARQPATSLSSQYDLLLADRDGSNERRLFPPAGAAGIERADYATHAPQFAWSPDARHIALIYQGNLWLVEVKSGAATQVTFDGAASYPVWSG
ncbi:MAG: hypothetical protein F4063_07265 [Chloroflexi bacterium]|nr:hypothetical protein [Chloroflexota bacterium]